MTPSPCLCRARRPSVRNCRLGCDFQNPSDLLPPAQSCLLKILLNPAPSNALKCFLYIKPCRLNCQTQGQEKCIHRCICVSRCFPHEVWLDPFLVNTSLFDPFFKTVSIADLFLNFPSPPNHLSFFLELSILLLSVGFWVDNLFFFFSLQHLKTIVLPPSAFCAV